MDMFNTAFRLLKSNPRLLVIIAVIIVALVSIWSLWGGSNQDSLLKGSQMHLHSREASCRSTNSSEYILFNLKTKLGVNYDGGHWFHMAENFLVQHSILRQSQKLTSAKNIIYNFDDASFVDKTNSVTRLLVLLGSVNAEDSHLISRVYFTHIPSLIGLRSDHPVFVSLSSSDFQKVKVFDLGPNIPVDEKLIKAVPLSDSLLSKGICVKYVATVGGKWPTPQRGHWFPHEQDVEILKSKISSLCDSSNAPSKSALMHSNISQAVNLDTNSKRLKQMVIYQRDQSRKLGNEPEALQLLSKKFPPSQWSIEVLMHNEKRSVCRLTEILSNADVLVTPHGFQSMLLLVMQKYALLFEIFPYKYFKRAYGPLGQEYGTFHGGVMSPATDWLSSIMLSMISSSSCMESKQCRNYARNHDVMLTARGVNALETLLHHRQLALQSLSSSTMGSASSLSFDHCNHQCSHNQFSNISTLLSHSSSSSAEFSTYFIPARCQTLCNVMFHARESLTMS